MTTSTKTTTTAPKTTTTTAAPKASTTSTPAGYSSTVANQQAAYNAANLSGIKAGTVTALKVDGINGPKTTAALSGGGGSANPGGTPIGSTTTTGKPTTIVTSAKSKSSYAENVNNLQKTTASLRTNQANDPSIVNFLSSNKMPSDYNSRKQLAEEKGIKGYIGSAAQNTQLLNILQGNTEDTSNKTDTTKVVDQSKVIQNTDGTTTTTNPDGTTTTTKPDGTSVVTTPDGTTTPGIPPELKKQYDEALTGLDQGIAEAKDTMEQAKRTLNDDPAATNAVNMIMAKYDQQIQIMKDKNAIMLGSANKNAARTGMMQYANEMSTSFLSQEQDKASGRVAALLMEEAQMVLKTQQAYKEGNVKEFDAASKAYQSAQKDKIAAISKLLDETDKAIKTHQAETKAIASAGKDAISNDIKLATALGKTVADTLVKSGIKDPAKVKQYIEAMAEKSGISNPDILQSSVIKAQQDLAKFNKTMTGKKGTTTTPGKITVSQGIAKVGPQMKAVAGPDGFIDPYQWVTARENWNALGLTDSTFNSNFKKYLNPESYSIAGFK